MTSEQIVSDIEEAFAGINRGSSVTLHETDVLDACGSEKERARARKQDTEKRWQDVRDDDIENHQNALCFLDPDGFRYYLPAYMRWSLRYFKSSGSLSSDSTIYALGPSGNKGVTDWNRSRWEVFTHRQSQVILAYLRFMAEQGEDYADSFMAELAINAYWNQFSQPANAPYSDEL